MAGPLTQHERELVQGAERLVQFIQASKPLGHSRYVLTTYADYISKEETGNPLPELVAPVAETNVVQLHRVKSG